MIMVLVESFECLVKYLVVEWMIRLVFSFSGFKR